MDNLPVTIFIDISCAYILLSRTFCYLPDSVSPALYDPHIFINLSYESCVYKGWVLF